MASFALSKLGRPSNISIWGPFGVPKVILKVSSQPSTLKLLIRISTHRLLLALAQIPIWKRLIILRYFSA